MLLLLLLSAFFSISETSMMALNRFRLGHLVRQGRAGAKVAEEAEELVRAACGEADDRVVSEAADLVYHALVLLACRDLTLARVEDELARRFGVSGLDEKAARTAAGGGGSR